MNALQLNAELYRTLGALAEDEKLLAKVLKYAKRLAAQKNDPTLMTKEEFLAKIRVAEEQVRQGMVYEMNDGETMDEFLERMRPDSAVH